MKEDHIHSKNPEKEALQIEKEEKKKCKYKIVSLGNLTIFYKSIEKEESCEFLYPAHKADPSKQLHQQVP